MKVLTIIVTIFIGYLIIEPSLGLLNVSIILEQIEDFDDNDGECNDICNPFLSCETCLGFTPSIVAPVLDTPLVPSPQVGQLHYLAQQHVFDVFHPPKLT